MQTIKKTMWLLALFLFTGTSGADIKEISVKLTVPDTTWTIAIYAVHQVENELWVVAVVSRDPDIMGAQMITTVQTSLKLTVPDLPVRYFVIGKTWGWQNPEPYAFIDYLKPIEKELAWGKRLYKATDQRNNSSD